MWDTCREHVSFGPLGISVAFLECSDRAQAATHLQLDIPLSSRLLMYGDTVEHTIRQLGENKCLTC